MVITIDLGPRSYSIVVAAGALGDVGSRLRELRLGSRTALVSDAAVGRLYRKTVTSSLEAAGFSVAAIEVPEGEGAKTLEVGERCWNELLAAGLDRTSTGLAPRAGPGSRARRARGRAAPRPPLRPHDPPRPRGRDGLRAPDPR